MAIGVTNFNFLGQRNFAFAFSGILMLGSLVAVLVWGMKFGIDFTGGTLVEVGYEQPVEPQKLRKLLQSGGFPDASAQHFGTAKDVLIRLGPHAEIKTEDLGTKVLAALNQPGEPVAAKRRIEYVGPQVGKDLAEKGALALVFVLIGILIYVGWRYEFRFSAGAVAGLVHDILITLGVFSVFGIEFDLTALGAVLAVLGYSLNDTVVVFDRIRENFRRIRRGSVEEVMNVSVNETLSRTIMTSLLTFLVVAAMAIFGGEVLRGFSIALIVGIIFGTYSSIYIASALALVMGISRNDLLLPEKEGANFDNVP